LLASLFDGRRAGKTFSQRHTSGIVQVFRSLHDNAIRRR
jgi:hypothetical protein